MPEDAQPTGADSARRQELLEAAYAWVLEHGWAGMSLRPLAEAIGSSPRVLLYLFGSKDGLIQALLARSRTAQMDVLDHLRHTDHAADLSVVGRSIWAWLAVDEHRPLLRLWLEAYSRSLDARHGPWVGFAAHTVADWDELLAGFQSARRRRSRAGIAERSLLLAVLRGALLDLLATGASDRLDQAISAHLAALRTVAKGSSP